MPRGSEDPPHCQSNLNRLKHWLDNGQGRGQATGAEAVIAGWHQHNVIHERRTRALDLIVSAVGLLGEAAATASNQRQNAGMTALQLLRFAILAKEVDYQRRILVGALNQMGAALIAPSTPQQAVQENDDLMGARDTTAGHSPPSRLGLRTSTGGIGPTYYRGWARPPTSPLA